MNRQRAGLLASDRNVEELAAAELATTGSAIAAVVAGFFVAAGRHPGVLLAPVTLLVAGVGQGGHAFDGRCVQPGRGAKRPRGLLPSAETPASARVALSGSVAALSVALVYEAELSLARLVRPGIQAAERAGSAARASLLKRVAGVGPAALAEPSFVQPVLRLASPSQGGLLTPSDFNAPSDLDRTTTERSGADGGWMEAPWALEPRGDAELGVGHAIVAVDALGRFAALAYRELHDGLSISELGLIAPFSAVPVRRGVARLTPGKRLPAPAPLALVRDSNSAVVAALAEPEAGELGDAADHTRIAIERDPRSRLVTLARSSG